MFRIEQIPHFVPDFIQEQHQGLGRTLFPSNKNPVKDNFFTGLICQSNIFCVRNDLRASDQPERLSISENEKGS